MTTFRFSGINQSYIAGLCTEFRNSVTAANPNWQDIAIGRVNRLVTTVGMRLYAVHSYENGKRLLRHNPGPSNFERQFPTAESFTRNRPDRAQEQYFQLVAAAQRNQFTTFLARHNGRRLPNCGILSMSVFASFVCAEGQRLRRNTTSPEAGQTRRWWQDLIWNNPPAGLRMPVFRVSSPGHGSNAVFIGPAWTSTHISDIANYVFFDIFYVPEGAEVRVEQPGLIGLSNSNVVELSTGGRIDLPFRGENPDNYFYFLRSGNTWSYRTTEPPEFQCRNCGGCEYVADRQIHNNSRCRRH